MENEASKETVNKEKSFKKMVIIVIISIIIIVVSAVMIKLFIFPEKDNNSANTYENELINADKLANNGEVEASIFAYDKIIDKTISLEKKSNILIAKALVYENNGAEKQALSTAKEAELAFPSLMVVDFIARIYEKLGDSENALTYYQKSLKKLDEKSPMYQTEKEVYDNKIIELQKVVL